MNLNDILKALDALPEDESENTIKDAESITQGMTFLPNPGPQLLAYYSEADELFYGGGAGCGKSSLLCGLAVNEFPKAIIFRREYPQIRGLVDEVARIIGTRDGYNSQERVWKLPNGHILEFGSVQHEDDKEKYQGRAHPLKGFDEITAFTESQYRFLIGWTRDAAQDQRCRVVCTGNPPMNAEGAWVIKYWAPWLDQAHPNPAKPGELRWFTTIDGEDVEVDGPGPHQIDGKSIVAKSRTFIGGKLEDNPDLLESGYAATLEAMPEPMRTMLREGRFDVAARDHDWQVIPMQWVIAAQSRWTPSGRNDYAMTAIGFDPAGGGKDAAELAIRYGGWYAELITAKGEETADGSKSAATIITHRRDSCPVIVDVGGGYGGSVLMRLSDNGIVADKFDGRATSFAKTIDGKLEFANKRAEAWWKFREALNPDQEGGACIALPPDAELRADLCAPRWTLKANGILLESKEEIKKRIGRSPGKGDAVVMALSPGNQAVKRHMSGGNPGVLTSKSAKRRGR